MVSDGTHVTAGKLNFKGDIRSTFQPRVYVTAHGLMAPEAVEYDEERDVTTMHLAPVRMQHDENR